MDATDRTPEVAAPYIFCYFVVILDLLDLDAALQALEALDPQHGRIVELRYFAGLSIEETAAALGTSESTVKRGWLAAKTFIRRLDGQ